jgi:predicted DNA-binding transcriptional regulator YafY
MALRPIPKARLPRAGRPSGHFTQHRRLDKLREALEGHPEGLTLDDLALLARVTTRSVRRYLHELSLITELDSVPTTPGHPNLWRIKPSERGRSVALRRTQAYGLLAARRVFDVLKGSALFDELDVTLREVALVARRPTRGAVKGEVPADHRLDERFLYVPMPARNYASKAEELDDLFQAVAELRVLRFRYRGPNDGPRAGERVTAHPYAMLVHKGELVCVAFDTSDRAVKVFRFDRMADTKPSEGERFTLPHDLSLDDFLHGELGVAAPPARATRVIVEFEARAADDVRARKIHPTQRIATAPDGRVRVSMNVASLDDARAWVMGFGSAARVIEPRELAIEVMTELRRALARYGA